MKKHFTLRPSHKAQGQSQSRRHKSVGIRIGDNASTASYLNDNNDILFPTGPKLPVAPRKQRDIEGMVSRDTQTDPDLIGADSAVETETVRVDLNEADEFLERKSQYTSREEDLEERGCCAALQRGHTACAQKCTKKTNGCLRGNRKSFPRRQHIIQFWRKQLNRRIPKKKLAIVVDGSSDLKVTYQELDEFSNSIAHHLKTMKFSSEFDNFNPDGELVVAVCLPSCYEYVVVLMAVLKLGAAFLPLPFDYPAERLAEIIKLTRPVLTITAAQEDELFAKVGALVNFDQITLDEIWNSLTSEISITNSTKTFKDPINSKKKRFPAMWKRTVVISVIPSASQDLQALRYNSAAIFNRYSWEKHFFPFLHTEHCIMQPNNESVDFIGTILTYMCAGITVVALQNPLDYYIPDSLFMVCSVYNVRRLVLFPGLLKGCAITMQLFEEHSQCVASIRYWFCIGGFMTSELAEMFFEVAPIIAKIIHMYHHEACLGPLSFEIFDTVKTTNNAEYFCRLPVGNPISCTDLYVLNENLKGVLDGDSGDIYVAGPQSPMIKPDYLNDPSNDFFVKNPFSSNKDRKIMIRTSDYGRIIEKSNGVRILIHDQSRTRYYYVENQVVMLVHIDTYLQRLPNLVSNAHTLCYQPNQDEQVILAFCILASPQVTAKQVEDELCNCLPITMIPEIVPVTEIPCSSNTGAVDENRLLEIYRNLKLERQVYQGWDSLELLHHHPHKLRAAKVLAYMIHLYIGTSVKEIMESQWEHPFLNIKRATFMKGVVIVRELHRSRYPVCMDSFMYAPTLQNIVEEMVIARRDRAAPHPDCPPDEILFVKNRYKLSLMQNNSKLGVCSFLAKCFTSRGQLDYYAQVDFNMMRRYFDQSWPIFANKKLSLVIRQKKERNLIVGAVLCMNWHDEMSLRNRVPQNIGYKLEMIKYLEGGLSLTDPRFNHSNVLQICYIGLDNVRLTNAEINGITDKVIRSILILAKVKKFDDVVVVSYDYFTFDICVHNYKFHVARECQANQFVASDGTRPYALCPDSLVASIMWKPLSKVQELKNEIPRLFNVAMDVTRGQKQK